MDYDVLIVGAGLSGIAAGIRLAHFGRRVCILERHRLPGGMNSYYRRRGRAIDVGLHALTNCAPPAEKSAPLNRLLRQLRLSRADLELCPQTWSDTRTPAATLRFANGVAELEASVAAAFPGEIDGFRRLVEEVRRRDSLSLHLQPQSARQALVEFIREPALGDLLLMPLMFYGNATPHDMDYNQFCVLFQSLYLEGFCRPRLGMAQVLKLLLARYEEGAGELRLGCGVASLEHDGRRVTGVFLDDGTRLTAPAVLSCAGLCETQALCQPEVPGEAAGVPGELGYVETLLFLDRPPRELGLDGCVHFVSETPVFHYARPAVPVDLRSMVLCCPGNYVGCEGGYADSQIRLTHLADGAFWLAADTAAYAGTKAAVVESQIRWLDQRWPGVRAAVREWEMFTPRTIQRYTGHANGAIYGSPEKRRDGTTALENLFLCGTDQGFLGIVGSLLSGVSIANAHLLR